MATDHNFLVKNGLDIDGANATIVQDGNETRITSTGEIRFRPEGSSSNKVRITLNTTHISGSLDASANVDANAFRINGTTVIDSDKDITINDKLTFSINSHYLQGGTNSLAFKNSVGSSYWVSTVDDFFINTDVVLPTAKKIIFGGDDTYNAHLQYTDSGNGDHYLSIKTEHNDTITERARFHAGTGNINVYGTFYTSGSATIGDGVNASLITRHIEGKHQSSNSLDALYLNYSSTHNVQIGHSGNNNDLLVYGAIRTGSTSRIDINGNLTNIGTISSGAITSSGNLTVNSNIVKIVNTSGQSDLRFEAANNNFSQVLFGDTDGTSRGTLRYKHDTDSFFIAAGGITNSDLEITNSAVNVTAGNLQIGGTTIVDSSRNLTNIGTISSGAITATSNSNQIRIMRTDDAGDDWRLYSWTDGLNIFPSDEASTVWFGRDGGNTDVSVYNGNLKIGTTTVIGSDRRFYPANIQGTSPISFLNGSGAQGISVRDIYAGTTYANRTGAAGTIDALNGFYVAGTTVIDSSRNLTNIGTIASKNITISIPDGGGAPANTAIFHLKGYEGRGAGIRIQDSVNSASNSNNREWFVGSGYGQSGFSIAYASDGSQSSYSAQNKLSISTAGHATFAGNVTTSGNLTTTTIDTGQGHTEVYLMNQNVRTTDSPTFDELTVTDFVKATGNNLKFSAGGTHVLNIDVNGKIYPNTHNAYDIGFSSSTAFRNAHFSGVGNFGTINTGQGATEVHLMNQNVRSSDSPTFADLTVTGNLNITGDINSYNVTDLDVVDKTITLGVGGTASANDGGGIVVDGANAKLTWNNTNSYWQMNKQLAFNDTATTSNQGLGIRWTGFDKEGTTDFTDRASIIHTVNTGGHSGSVLLFTAENDANDGIAFVTNASSRLKHNSNNIFTDAYHPNADTLTTARTIAGTSFDGSANIDISYDNLTNKPSDISNSDTVDGLHAASFLRSDTADTASGDITITGSTTKALTIGNGSVRRELKINSNTWPEVTFYNNSTENVRIGSAQTSSTYNTTEGDFYVYAPSTNKMNLIVPEDGGSFTRYNGAYTIWDSGNDGPGSGLNADTLDGVQGSQFLRSDVNDSLFSGNATLQFENQSSFARMAFYKLSLWEWNVGEQLVIDGGVFEVKSSEFRHTGGYAEFGNSTGSVSNDGSWNARLNVAGSSHARLDVKSVSDGIITTMYAHTGHGVGRVGTMSNHNLALMVNTATRATLDTSGNLDIDGNIEHTGLTMTSGTDVDQLYSVTKSITLSTSWQDTGIIFNNLATGSYIIQVKADDHSVGGQQYSEFYTGVMSWYASGTNSTNTDEINLHRAGHASNAGDIFLRTARVTGNTSPNLHLEIRGSTSNTGASNYVFKFRRLI